MSSRQARIEHEKHTPSLARISTSAEGDVIAVAEVTRTKPFNNLSVLSLAVALMATWEALLCSMGSGLTAGGPVSLVYGFIVSFIGSISTAMSLAEPASMFPLAGGQYQILAEIAPAKYRNALTWYCTWLTALGWLALSASAPFLASQLIEGLISLHNSEYAPKRWQASCIYWGIILVGYSANLWCFKILPMLENVVMAIHIVFFVVVFAVVLALPPRRNSASFVFTEFLNSTGWSSDGVAWCLGLLTSSYVMVGYDSAMHMAEDMQHPRLGVPRAMVGCVAINAVMGFAMLIAILFGMGDLETALGSPTGFPIIAIFDWITKGNAAAVTALICTIIFSAAMATLGLQASSSRILHAAARDRVIPGSRWLSRLDSKRGMPVRALTCTSILLALIELLNIASTTAFTAILSLAVVALYISYLLPVICMLYRKVQTPERLQYGPWRLQIWLGLLANMVSICYTIFASVFLLFPSVRPVTKNNMNYAAVVLGSVSIFSVVGYLAHGRKYYEGPRRV